MERSADGYFPFFPKGRAADDTWDVRGIIGHPGGYGPAPMLSHNARLEFEGITPEPVRFSSPLE